MGTQSSIQHLHKDISSFKTLEEKRILSTSREKKLIRGIRNYNDFGLHNSITASKKKMELCPESQRKITCNLQLQTLKLSEGRMMVSENTFSTHSVSQEARGDMFHQNESINQERTRHSTEQMRVPNRRGSRRNSLEDSEQTSPNASWKLDQTAAQSGRQESTQTCCRMYDHDPYCFGVVFLKINTWIDALENLSKVRMWWSWQVADKSALSFRPCCLYWLWTCISSHWSFLLLFRSESWKKAMVSQEARSPGQSTSLPQVRCLAPVLYYSPSKFTDWWASAFPELMHGLLPLPNPEGALVNPQEAEV